MSLASQMVTAQRCAVGMASFGHVRVRLSPLLTVVLLLGFVPVSVAGSYVEVYRGGATGSDGNYGMIGPNEWGGSDTGSQSARCSGKVTAIFTWQPLGVHDAPPTSVIITTTTSVSFGVSEGAGYGKCDDGQGDRVVRTQQQSCSGSAHKTAYAVVRDPGITFTAACSPGSNCVVSDGRVLPLTVPTLTQGLPKRQSGPSCTAAVSCSISASPVIVSPAGCVLDDTGAYNILIGQTCTASLEGIPSVWTALTYHWSVTDSSQTFQAWLPVDPGNSQASLLKSGPGALEDATASWFWVFGAAPGSSRNETVSCTATGRLPGETLALTVTASQTITVYTPLWVVTGTPGAVDVYLDTDGSLGKPAGQYWLVALGTATSYPHGMTWNATVTSPRPDIFGDGTVEMCQLATLFRSISPKGSSTVFVANVSGQKGLDAVFPYSTAAQTYNAGDSPYLCLNGVSAATLADTFEDILMYVPPGTSQCVPLTAPFNWRCYGSVLEQQVGRRATSVGTVTCDSSFKPGATFPEWTRILPNQLQMYQKDQK